MSQDRRRVLLVTEHIETGGTIQRLIDLFENAGIEIDVATIKAQRDEHGDLPFKFSNKFANVIVGEEDEDWFMRPSYHLVTPPKIWGQQHLTGLHKPLWQGDEVRVLTENEAFGIKKIVASARNDVRNLTNKIINHLYFPAAV